MPGISQLRICIWGATTSTWAECLSAYQGWKGKGCGYSDLEIFCIWIVYVPCYRNSVSPATFTLTKSDFLVLQVSRWHWMWRKRSRPLQLTSYCWVASRCSNGNFVLVNNSIFLFMKAAYLVIESLFFFFFNCSCLFIQTFSQSFETPW